MEPKDYRIGLVVARQGLTDRQVVWIVRQLEMVVTLHRRVAGTDAKVILYIPGYSNKKAEHFGLDRSVWNMRRPEGVWPELLVGEKRCKQAVAAIEAQFEFYDVDEVWCCPIANQTILSRTRAPMIYYRGQVKDPRKAHAYKMVPSGWRLSL